MKRRMRRGGTLASWEGTWVTCRIVVVEAKSYRMVRMEQELSRAHEVRRVVEAVGIGR